MAKWGEGDPRWIVEERPDARNVNNWHWSEKNATGWSKERLKELLENLVIEEGSVVITCQKFSKLNGDASASNRKAKLIFLYEWEITLPFEGKIAGSDDTYKGEINVLNLADEYDIDEIDIEVRVDSGGIHRDLVRQTILKTKIIREKLEEYVNLLKKEYSKDIILPTNNVKPQVISKGKTVISSSSSNAGKSIAGAPKVDAAGACSSNFEKVSFTLKDTFKVPPPQLYTFFTEQQLVAAWTRSIAKYEFKEGGDFAFFGGNVSGTFTKIVPNKSVETKWRLKSYPSGHYATIVFEIADDENATAMTIRASGVPITAEEETKTGLDRYYLHSIGTTFGISTRLC